MLLSGGRQHLESKEIDWVGAGHSLLLTVQIGYSMSPRRGSWRDRCLGLKQLKPSKNLGCRKGVRNATQAYGAGVGRNRHSLLLSTLLMVTFHHHCVYSFSNQRSTEFQGRREMALAPVHGVAKSQTQLSDWTELKNCVFYVEGQSLESWKYS